LTPVWEVVQLSSRSIGFITRRRKEFNAAKKVLQQELAKEIDPIRATIISMSENIHRRELPYRDMVEACDKLFEKYHNTNLIAEELSVSPQTVQNYLGHRLVPEHHATPRKVVVR